MTPIALFGRGMLCPGRRLSAARPGASAPPGPARQLRLAGRGPRAGQTGRVTDVIRVDDSGDPRLADYVRLTDSSLRTSLEAAHGLFVAEGEKVIRRAVGAGYPVRSLLVTPDRMAGLADLAGTCACPVYVTPHVFGEVISV